MSADASGSDSAAPARDDLRPDSDPAFARAAAALRRRDCAGALSTVDPLLSTLPDGRFARLVLGLYSHACELPAAAEHHLSTAAEPGGLLEDWRLFLLADSAIANGHELTAQAALAKLLADYADSPLRPRAFAQAARLAWGRQDARRAVETVDRARREPVGGDEGRQIEVLAWEIATVTGDGAARHEAGRRLLIAWPAQATELRVAEVFRRPDGGLEWAQLLTAKELEQRSAALVALDLTAGALGALDAVRLDNRELAWYLLKAEVLTHDHQGAEALKLLAGLDGVAAEPAARARLEWARARAAADLAVARRGHPGLTAAKRHAFAIAAQGHLERVAELASERDLTLRALRALYGRLAEAELFDRSIDTLRRLRALDSTDTTGTTHLWQLGWRDYERRNFSGAVAYWTHLVDLYPEDRDARRGRYWTARAFEALNEPERAQRIYAELAASDTSDLYSRYALGRVRRPMAASRARLLTAEPADLEEPAEVWPDSPVLHRARLLSDLALDDLASSELDLVRDRAPKRPLAALEALILARRGDRRRSMLAIRTAFPALGSSHQASLPELARRLYYPLDYQETIRVWAAANHLSPYIVYGMIRQESGFDVNAVSSAGARGLMQLMPPTAKELARRFGVPFSRERMGDPAFNLQIGTAYFRQVLGMFGGNLELALAGYNAGPFRIKRLWNQSGKGELDRFLEGLDIEESKIYVKRILVLSDSYRQLYPAAG